MQSFGLGFLVRGRDYHLLDHPAVQARLQQSCDLMLTQPETRICREVFDVGTVAEWLEPVPGLGLTCRVVVTRRAAPADPTDLPVGKLVAGHVYELFLTTRPIRSLTAADVLDLYNGRGAFEQVLSDEDVEQDPDRWCSHQPRGQEFWQVLSQWVWNTRLELGRVCQPQPPRWTRWSDGAPVAPPTPPPVPAASVAPTDQELVAVYGPLEWAQAWAKSRGRFAGSDFEVVDAATLRCPAGKVLRLREQRSIENGDVRVFFSAREGDCRACALADRCLGRGAAGANPQRVSAVQRLLGRYARPASTVVEAAPLAGSPPHDLLWGDVGGRRLRRDLVWWLRRQTVRIERLPSRSLTPAAVPRTWTRAERAHRRLSWATRLERSALPAGAATYRVRLFGIAPVLAQFLGLSSVVTD